MPVYRFTQTPERLITFTHLHGFAAAIYALEAQIGRHTASGYFWSMRRVSSTLLLGPIERGVIEIASQPVKYIIPGVCVSFCEPALGMWRCDFTTGSEQPPPWKGPGVQPATLDELVKLWEKDVGRPGAARFNSEGGFAL